MVGEIGSQELGLPNERRNWQVGQLEIQEAGWGRWKQLMATEPEHLWKEGENQLSSGKN